MKRVRNKSTLGTVACLLALLASGLIGCGSPSPQGFIWSSANGVAFLTWTSQNDQLSGTYALATADGQEEGRTLTGQQQDPTHVNLQVDVAVVDTAGTGSVGQIIEMSGILAGSTMQTIDTTTGSAQLWYAGTNQQYEQLQTAYQTFVQFHYDLFLFHAITLVPSEDSSPEEYQSALNQATGRVKDEQHALTALEQQHDPKQICNALETFSLDYPSPNQDSVLQLPMWQPGDTSPLAVVDRSALAHITTLLLIHGQQAQNLPLPVIAGLPLPWKMDSAQMIQAQVQARQQLAALKRVILTVASQLSPLRAQAQQIQTQVASLKQEHHCLG